MPQTVPTATVGFSPSSFDYSAFQFDLSLLSDDYGTQNTTTMAISATPTSLSTNHLQVLGSSNTLKPLQIKQEARSPRPVSPLSSANYASPSYPCLSGGGGGGGELSPNYSRDASPAYPASPYYLPQSPQSAQLYPTSPEPSLTTAVALQPANGNCNKPPVKREKSFDLLTILHESRLLAESLGYKEDSTDCTVPCTPPRTEEDIYNSLDADFFPKRESTVVANPLLKEILFKEESSRRLSSSSSSAASTCSSSSLASSPAPAPCVDYEKSSLRDLLFRNTAKDEETSSSSSNGSTILKLDKCPGIGTPTAKESDVEKSADHQLLREVLRDTSFQRKYNLKPMDLGNIGATTTYVDEMAVVDDGQGGECVGDLAREQIEPVLSLAIQQLQKDFDNTCVALGIHPEPCRWSAVDVAAWVQWARRQLQLPSVPLESFNVDGATLASFSEEDFCQRAPQCGSMLYAQLEIWKAAVEESPRNSLTSAWTPTAVVQSPSNGSSSPSTASSAPGSVKDSSNMEYSDEEDDEASTAEASSDGATGGKIRSSGSHIHLWQFLKKLLQSPSSHGSCIRWLDRNKGVFKIEDSVRVARLWGKRKNRPAMNYDKLSRSIRQYYKKGIMKKTERSQRLVYQFCHPYCL